MLESRPSAEWVRVLEPVGVACAPVQRLPEVLASDQVQVLGMVGTLHPTAGEVPTVRLPLNFSSARSTAETPPPLLGADGQRGFA